MLKVSAGYHDLLGTLDRWFEAARAASAPGTIPCARGCSACCHGPFDISPADAALVVQAVDALPPEIALVVRQDARTQLAQQADQFTIWQAPWDVEQLPDDVFDRLSEEFADLPCPALDSEGSCLIHDSRPATCRITGLGMLLPAGDVLENVCPIQEQFPTYAALAPTLFDLLSFETEADWWDELAKANGHVSTTVAGALG